MGRRADVPSISIFGIRLRRRRARRGLSAFRLIVGLGVLVVLVGFAMPRTIGRAAVAREIADVGAIDEVIAALNLAHMDHRATDAPPQQWVLSVDDLAPIMHRGRLPDGLECTAEGKVQDRRGHRYTLTAETLTSAALLTRDP